jgi:hypothetical protein
MRKSAPLSPLVDDQRNSSTPALTTFSKMAKKAQSFFTQQTDSARLSSGIVGLQGDRGDGEFDNLFHISFKVFLCFGCCSTCTDVVC